MRSISSSHEGRSSISPATLLGRRGPEHAAYTRPELLALKHLPGVGLLVDDHDARIGATIDAAGPGDRVGLLRGVAREAVDWSLAPGTAGRRRRIVFRFLSTPVEVHGDETVRAVRATGGAGEQEIPAGLALRAVGHRGAPRRDCRSTRTPGPFRTSAAGCPAGPGPTSWAGSNEGLREASEPTAGARPRRSAPCWPTRSRAYCPRRPADRRHSAASHAAGAADSPPSTPSSRHSHHRARVPTLEAGLDAEAAQTSPDRPVEGGAPGRIVPCASGTEVGDHRPRAPSARAPHRRAALSPPLLLFGTDFTNPPGRDDTGCRAHLHYAA